MTRQSMLRDVVDFNGTVIQKRVNSGLQIKPVNERVSMQLKLIDEELKELKHELSEWFIHGSQTDDLRDEENHAALSKEICDVLYVVLGLAFHLNLDIDSVWTFVHTNNMHKMVNGHFREDGKLVKPEGFVTYKPEQVPDLYDDILDFVAPM